MLITERNAIFTLWRAAGENRDIGPAAPGFCPQHTEDRYPNDGDGLACVTAGRGAIFG
jgi:hypothetical protein